MNRRSFLAALGVAPIAAAGAATAAPKPLSATNGYVVPLDHYTTGECGPEAILPLRRGSDGHLPFTGIRSADGRLVITVDQITIKS
ncbi:secreted protein [Pseudaminobacter salicylatoxidans]|uniref:Secreted protein n=1 Tax=Pseudaminobacter salicylatoxidans TaxID=93369 RepID=A0A316C0H5_PSESE|nr:twin-arginine translocation signal domain-containing protein [Pseudaminobacter salicylatoxidans]PWJ81481.1 secreted protein [Pseudaminobacter salicylatoxidans]